jgi:hypothetical protein
MSIINVKKEGNNATVTLKDSSKAVITKSDKSVILTATKQGPAGPKGDTGSAGPGSTYYNHAQTAASTTWTINHNLGRIPSITVIDTAGSEIEGDYAYPSVNTVVLTFSAATGGTAYLR